MKDSKRTSLIHFGKDNIRYESEYEVHDFLDVQKQINKIEFRIFIKDYKEIEWFDFKLFVMPDNSLKVTDMFVGNSSQRMKGKSEAAILEAKKVFQKKIISSSNKEDVIYEWRRG